EALGIGQAAIPQVGQHLAIVVGVDHDGNILVVLGGGADPGRAADSDVLDRLGQGAARLGHGCGEGIEVDHHHVDRLDTVLSHDRAVQIAATENAAMDLRVQGFHPAIHHFREAGVVGYFHDVDVVVAQQLPGA